MAEIGAIKKKQGPVPKVSNEEIEEALIKAHGLISVAARYISKAKTEENGKPFSIARQVVDRRIKKNPRLMEVMRQCDEDALDFAENKLMIAVDNGDMTAIIFYLKCKGKRRGYIERAAIEVSGESGGAIKVEQQSRPDLTKLTDKEFETLAELSAKAGGFSVPAEI